MDYKSCTIIQRIIEFWWNYHLKKMQNHFIYYKGTTVNALQRIIIYFISTNCQWIYLFKHLAEHFSFFINSYFMDFACAAFSHHQLHRNFTTLKMIIMNFVRNSLCGAIVKIRKHNSVMPELWFDLCSFADKIWKIRNKQTVKYFTRQKKKTLKIFTSSDNNKLVVWTNRITDKKGSGTKWIWNWFWGQY